MSPVYDTTIIRDLCDNHQGHRLHDLPHIFNRESEKSDGISNETRSAICLLRDAASMTLIPSSLNDPFRAQIQLSDGRSAAPEDFSETDLETLKALLPFLSHELLAARINDLLWILCRPKQRDHAMCAIDYYNAGKISPDTWLTEGKYNYQRAYRLARSINDIDRINQIESNLLAAFNATECIDIAISLAELFEELTALKFSNVDIASRLEYLGTDFMSSSKYLLAIRAFELSSRFYKRTSDENKSVEMLFLSAQCHAENAKQHFESQSGEKLISASLLDNAIQAFRRIPKKHREIYSVDSQILELRESLSQAGKHTLSQMGVIRTPINGAEELIAASVDHVANKTSEYEALIYFSTVNSVPDYSSLKKTAMENIKEFPLSSLFDSVQYSRDGRVIAKVPGLGWNPSDEKLKEVLHVKMVQSFAHDIQLIVKLAIEPALRQMLSEHVFSKSFIYELCLRSPIVPESNAQLISRAIWLGFEGEFSTAIFIIAPHFETIVRALFKKHNVHTTKIDEKGIEHENGLSTLLDKPEADSVLGLDLRFELMAVFGDSFGPNLRNETAHGLLTDSDSWSAAPIYGWWMLLRIIIHSNLHASMDDVGETT